jgi:hypothetical protein
VAGAQLRLLQMLGGVSAALVYRLGDMAAVEAQQLAGMLGGGQCLSSGGGGNAGGQACRQLMPLHMSMAQLMSVAATLHGNRCLSLSS